MKRLFNLFFLIPLAIVLILLSVANRQPTTFSLDPLNADTPALAFELPLFVYLFLALILGIFIGSFLTWVSQGKHRKALREKSYEATRLEQEKTSDTGSKAKEDTPEIAPGLPLISGS